jgi:hypothetical protein
MIEDDLASFDTHYISYNCILYVNLIIIQLFASNIRLKKYLSSDKCMNIKQDHMEEYIQI